MTLYSHLEMTVHGTILQTRGVPQAAKLLNHPLAYHPVLV